MKRAKRLRNMMCSILALTMLVSATTFASVGMESEIKILLNGKHFVAKDSKGNELQALVKNGITYLPLRAISEALDIPVKWDNSIRSVILGGEPPSNAVKSSEMTIYLNGKFFAAKAASGKLLKPLSINGVTYLPLRAISEALNIPVNWDSAQRIVVLGTEKNIEKAHSNNESYTTSPQKLSVETKIYDALDKVQTTLVIPSKELKGRDVFKIIDEIYSNNYFFYYEGVEYTEDRNNINIRFFYTAGQNNKVMKETLDKVTREIIEQNITPQMNDYEKVKALHDYIVLNSAYDYQNYLDNKIPPSSYNAYGALVKNVAVCQGYAEALHLLFKKIGIQSYVIDGEMKTGGSHAWNLVKVDGNYYHLDATHNDPVPDQKGVLKHTYFLMTDEMMRKTRDWEPKTYPKCDTLTYNYFYFNNLIVNSEEAFIQRVKDAIGEKKQSFIIKYEDFKFNMNLLERAIDNAQYDNGYYYSIDDVNQCILLEGLTY